MKQIETRQAAGHVLCHDITVTPVVEQKLAEYGIPVVRHAACPDDRETIARAIFDLLLCRAAAGVEITRRDIVGLGEGGLCLNCPACVWPNCGFGK